jgi:hypothetical protein
MEMIEIALVVVLSALAGATATRLFDLRQLKAKQKVLNDCVISLSRAIKLNDQMLYMLDGKTFEDAQLAADLDEIWRLNP